MFQLLLGLNIVAYFILFFIITILVITVYLSLKIRKKYNIIIDDLNDKKNRREGSFESEMLNNIVSDYSDAVKENIIEINTEALIENNIHMSLHKEIIGERFVNKSTSLMIVLGLLGTFYGLTLSIGDIVVLLTSTATSIVGDVGSITGGLLGAVQSMSVAFVTSLFGIASSIVVHLISVLFHLGEKRERVMISIEEYLDNYVGRRSGASDFDLDVNGNMKLEVKLDKLSESIENSLINLAESLGDKLASSTEELSKSSREMSEVLGSFDKSVDKFSENVTDFTEFNHHLKSNIQRMSLTFDDHNNEIKSQISEIKKVKGIANANNTSIDKKE
jgi:methyl-accepting chemotaxis protein